MKRIVVILSLLAGPGISNAGKVQVWRQETAKDFGAGEIARLVVTSDGKHLSDHEAIHVDFDWKVTD